MNRLVGKTPEHEIIYLKIKDMILFGEFLPGQSVTIHGVRDQIEAGATPVREAIRRLVAEGALSVLENRRVCIPYMTADTLSQIEIARLTIEPELAERGCGRIPPNKISELEAHDAMVDTAIQAGDVRSYLEANYLFHMTLYKQADAPVLERISQSLWMQIGPALRVVCGRYGTANIVDQHKAAIDALKAGDAAATRVAIEKDIQQGIEFVRNALSDS